MLKAGTCRINITPYIGCPMAGYRARDDVSQGIHDELYAKILVLESDETVVLVTADLVGVPGVVVRRVRELASQKTGIAADHIVISATHTHSGPELREERSSAVSSYTDTLVRDIAGGIYAAWRTRKEAKAAFGQGRIEGIGVNRRHENGHPVDPSIGVLRVDTDNGSPMAVFINYTCHAVVLGPDNLLFSADYPGYTMRLIETIVSDPSAGGPVVAMFSNGASGDVNTGHSADLSALGYPIPGRTFERAQKLGTMLAGEVLRVIESVEPVEDLAVQAATKEVELTLKPLPPLEELEADARQKKRILEGLTDRGVTGERLLKAQVDEFYAELLATRATERKDERIEGQVEIELQAVRIGDTALLAFPGEMFVEIGLDIKRSSPFGQTFVLGLTNGLVGYLPTKGAFDEGGYESTSARFVRESADIVIEGALELLRSLEE